MMGVSAAAEVEAMAGLTEAVAGITVGLTVALEYLKVKAVSVNLTVPCK